ncbi:hypothetical protein F2P56_015208 [Juglans regia]|uniref:RNase H type-1 domain-containing protein n=2 Tax=Juglans regia TaxID=51240 RepID=A0A833XF84_JUGRE|nr:uncharacterized protein LOC108987311 [Juglans regia]KAF5465179.1 hypothetical protein F2P56_015208 [Juglans regia]
MDLDGEQEDVLLVSQKILQTGIAGSLEKIFLMAWVFWHRRNLFLYGVVQSPALSMEHVLLLYKEYDESHKSSSQALDMNYKWHPPPAAALKLNTDGAIFADLSSSGIGVILRDSQGKVLLSTSGREIVVQDPIEVELLVILRGLQLCIPMGISKLIVESDSLLSVQAIQNMKEPMSMQGNLIYAIKDLMTLLPNVSVQHANQLSNRTADGLAKHARFQDTLAVWEIIFLILLL